MAQIIIKGVKFSPTNPTIPQKVSVKYRLASDPDVPASYIIIGTDITINIDGTFDPVITLNGLIADSSYVIVVTNNCNGKPVASTVTTENPITYAWIEDLYVCEQDALITQLFQAAGFSSPNKMYYHSGKNRMYVVDSDNAAGNIYYFNPTTFSGTASVTVIPAIQKIIYDSTIDFDNIRKRIYLAGPNTGGLIIFDMNTDTVIQNVAYPGEGANNSFNRILVKNLGDNIYCTYGTSGSGNITHLAIINANTFSKVEKPIADIPFGSSSLSGSCQLYQVNNTIWVAAAAGRSNSSIWVYDNTFSTRLAEIILPSAIPTWGSGRYWGSGIFDSEKNKFYYHDIGSSQTYIIDGTTRSILKTQQYNNREGKAYVQIDFSLDPNIGNLYFNYTAYNSISDAANTFKRRSYVFDRDSLELDQLYPGLITSALTIQEGSAFLWSASRNKAIWDSPNTGYNTDGVITKLSY